MTTGEKNYISRQSHVDDNYSSSALAIEVRCLFVWNQAKQSYSMFIACYRFACKPLLFTYKDLVCDSWTLYTAPWLFTIRLSNLWGAIHKSHHTNLTFFLTQRSHNVRHLSNIMLCKFGLFVITPSPQTALAIYILTEPPSTPFFRALYLIRY